MSSDGNNNGLSSFLVDKKGHDLIKKIQQDGGRTLGFWEALLKKGISRSLLTDTDVRFVVERSNPKWLTNIVLGECSGMLTDSSLFFIGDAAPNLKTLQIASCTDITKEGIKYVSRKCKRLKILDY